VPEATGQPLHFVSRGRTQAGLNVIADPVLHRKAATRAEAEGMSLNAWIARQIEAA
jgi:predicted HicB family RNase H-like nuclease